MRRHPAQSCTRNHLTLNTQKCFFKCQVSSESVVRGENKKRGGSGGRQPPGQYPSRGGSWGGEAPPAKIRGVWGAAPPSQNRKFFENFSKNFENFFNGTLRKFSVCRLLSAHKCQEAPTHGPLKGLATGIVRLRFQSLQELSSQL